MEIIDVGRIVFVLLAVFALAVCVRAMFVTTKELHDTDKPFCLTCCGPCRFSGK